MTDTIHGAAPNAEALSEQWLTLWRSEMTAIAADREMRESWAVMTGLWAQTVQAATAAATAAAFAVTPHESQGGASADEPAGAAPAAAAPDPRLDEVEQLNRRVAELEERLATLTGGPAQPSRTDRTARSRRKV